MANKKQLTIKDVNAKVDKLADSVARLAKSVESLLTPLREPTGAAEPEKYPVLSEITEIGAVVDLGELGSIRLLDTDYNGTGKKIWQFVNVLKGDEVGLGLPDGDNKGGYPSAEKVLDTLHDIFETLPAWLRNQIVDMEVPCYIPEKKEIESYSDPIFLLSATEMCQNRSYLAKEGRPLEFYIKNTPEFNDWHWLRTPYLGYSYGWGGVNGGGDVYNYSTYDDSGVAPAFCTD
jgi:hypothetical protein